MKLYKDFLRVSILKQMLLPALIFLCILLSSCSNQTKYSPFCYENGAFIKTPAGRQVTCQCCGKQTEYYHEGMYATEEVKCLCPDCIASGAAAEKFEGDFIQDAEEIDGDINKMDELFHRTPGFVTFCFLISTLPQ